MNTNLTEITVVVDRSGSMVSIKKAMEGAFKEFLNEQKREEGECLLSLYSFDGSGWGWTKESGLRLEEHYVGRDIRTADNLVINPRGNTPLYDAIGEVIIRTGKRYSDMREHARPGRVVFVIITDGYENASQNFTVSQIRDKIKTQENQYNWKFVYLGANQDAIAVGESMGISSDYSIDYAASESGVACTGKVLSQKMSATRCCSFDSYTAGDSLKFNDEDRKSCMGFFQE